jgi:hypothetical protein
VEAVYFCVLEALQNTAKYAEASHATIRLAKRNGEVTFPAPGCKGCSTGSKRWAAGWRSTRPPNRGTIVRGRIRVA